MAQQASSSSPSISRYTYDVFLSFRGEDTRYGFTGNLYSAFSQRGIFAFIDDAALRKGEEISPSLRKAIQESRMSIVIFSKNYAFSTFCLDELVQILECYTKQNMWILPVFYDVDPSQVWHQIGSYEEAFAKHEGGRFKDDAEKVQTWRLALRKAANLSGSHFKIREEYEFEFIKKITEDVSNKLNRNPLHIADYPVGLQARMQQIQWLMGADEFDNKVTMLGIHGMGGIGKSTLARAIYNLVSHQFEGSCFLADVREKSSTKQGLVQIQETMLSELVGERDIKLGDVNQGKPLLQHRLCQKKVLLVVDDIDKKEQLQATAGGLDWFGPGSMIIITTRDKHLLDIHGVDKLYEVNELDNIEAGKLLRWNAFKNKKVDSNYREIIKRAIYYAQGLPLALEIIGSNLFDKTLDEWESALEAYQRIPNRDVQEILRVSYDSLDVDEKEIFLEIACFFRGCSLIYIIDMLEARGFHPKFGIGVLKKKSLIKIHIDRDNDKIVMMHDLIQSMGREIVRQQSTMPQKRNRLWFYVDIFCILEKNRENDKIEALMLDMPEDQEVQWNQEVFVKMTNLQMLLIKKSVGFLRRPIDLPNSLRVLEWLGYPETSLPSNFHPKNLFLLNLSYSYFRLDKPLQNSKVLQHLFLRGCQSITRIPDMSGSPNLTKLYVSRCTNLIEIHDSVGFLHNLQKLCAFRCTKLKIVPRGIKSTSLVCLDFLRCSSLAMFPEILAPMHKLYFVDLRGTAIRNLPPSMQNLEGLGKLCLNRFVMHKSVEQSNFINRLPEFFSNLEFLTLEFSNLEILPICIGECHSLKILYVNNCKKLQEVKGLPPSIVEFSAKNTLLEAHSSFSNILKRAIDSTNNATALFILPGQRIPEWFDHSTRGDSLSFWFRNEFPSLAVCAVSGAWDNIKPPFPMEIKFFARINDIDVTIPLFPFTTSTTISEKDHIFIVRTKHNVQRPMNINIERALEQNEWIHGSVSFVMKPKEYSRYLGVIKWIGIYVNRAFSKMEDVQFTDPYAPNNTTDVGNELVLHCDTPDIQQQQQPLALFNPTISLGSEIEQQPLNNVSNNSNSCEPPRTTDRSNDQDGALLDHQAMTPSFAETQNDQAQSEIGTPISEVSRESTASESHKVDEVESGLDTEKNHFSKAMVLVNELQKRLSWVKKMNDDLGEQLRAINGNISAIEANHSSIRANISSLKADISASQSERNMDCKRITNIIEKGNTDMNES